MSISKKILIILPSPMMARNFLQGDSLNILTGTMNATVDVISPSRDDQRLTERFGASWHPYFHPRRSREPGKENLPRLLIRMERYARYLAGRLLHMSLTYRFNTISEFQGFKSRLRQSWSLRKIYVREGLPMSWLFGIPLPRNQAIYKFLKWVYYSRWQSFSPVERLLSELKPDLIVLSAVQMHMVTSYALAAKRLKIPVLGVNGSWDQPTTKGPLIPGVERIVVQNEIVKDELERYHQIAPGQIQVIGWLQMDGFSSRPRIDKTELFARIGIPFSHRYILFAANAPRLGMHEPVIFKALATLVQSGEFGNDVTLVCRCHPQDSAWQERWGWTRALDNVLLEAPDLGPLDHLASLIGNAAIVIASAGSINLDAIALDTPTIGLAWEDPALPYQNQHARAYDLEHLSELRNSPGIAIVHNMNELAAACARYMNHRSEDAAGRAALRQRYLYRLDGNAAIRLAAEIAEMLE